MYMHGITVRTKSLYHTIFLRVDSMGTSNQNLFLKKPYILHVAIAYKLLFFFRLEYKLCGFFFVYKYINYTENVSFLWDHLYPGYVDIAYKVKFFFSS